MGLFPTVGELGVVHNKTWNIPSKCLGPLTEVSGLASKLQSGFVANNPSHFWKNNKDSLFPLAEAQETCEDKTVNNKN